MVKKRKTTTKEYQARKAYKEQEKKRVRTKRYNTTSTDTRVDTEPRTEPNQPS